MSPKRQRRLGRVPSRLVLDNGMTIVVKEKDTESVSLGIGVRLGYAHHPAAHFVEHMVFAGTTSRGAQAIAKEAVQWGGHIDGYTDAYSTFFFAKNLSRYAESSLELLCDIVKNSTFPNDRLEREKLAYQEELRNKRDDPELVLLDALYREVYQRHPIRTTILEDPRLATEVTRDELFAAYQRFYIPSRLILVAVGNVKRDDVHRITERCFGKTPWGFSEPLRIAREAIPGQSRRILLERPGSQQAHLMIGFRAPHYPSRDYYAMRVLSSLLNEDTGSALYRELRERRGLVYNIVSSYANSRRTEAFFPYSNSPVSDCSRWHGIFRIMARLSQKNLAEVEQIIGEQLQKCIEGEFTAEELCMSQLRLIGRRHLALEGTLKYARLLFAAELNDDFSGFDEFDRHVFAVERKDVQRVARLYCSPKAMTTVVLGS